MLQAQTQRRIDIHFPPSYTVTLQEKPTENEVRKETPVARRHESVRRTGDAFVKTRIRRGDDKTLIYQRDRIFEGIKFSGHSQIDTLFSNEFVMALGNPPAVKAEWDEITKTVRVIASWEGGVKVRRTTWSRIVSSLDLARVLYQLNPQGRFFDINHIEGGRLAVITQGDVVGFYSYHRFYPGEPMLSPTRNREAGEEYDRTGKMPEPQYQVPEPELGDNLVPMTVQTGVPKQPTVNQITLPSPRSFGLPFDTIEELRGAIQSEVRTATPEELIYIKAYTAMRNNQTSQEGVL